MDLGKSLRRRRSGKGNSEASGGSKRRGEGKRQSGSFSGWTGPRGILVGVVTLILGSATGYVYATQVAFPAGDARVESLLEVPDLRGGSQSEARVLLEERNLTLGRVDSIRHPRVPEGQVVGQTPFPGQSALPGGAVELSVSLGPERRPVPDVTRLRSDRALTVLQTTGFEVVVDSVDAEEPAGRVVSTDPSAGTTAVLPSEIRMVVSLGPPMVEMPDLTGRQEDEARAALEELGLTVGEVRSRFQFGFRRGEVLGTVPEAGEMVPRGGEVQLEVGTRGFSGDDGDDGNVEGDRVRDGGDGSEDHGRDDDGDDGGTR